MLHNRCRVEALDVGEGVSPAFRADQKAVALRVVSRPDRARIHPDEASITVFAMAGGDSLADDAALGSSADVDHLRSGVCLLVIICHGHRIELRGGIVTLEDCRGIFPSDGGACLDLGPAQMCPTTLAYSSLSHKVKNTAPALRVARIPDLYRGIPHISVFLHHDFHHSRMKLVLVSHRSRATLHIA